MRRFRKEFGLKKARILRERLIPVSQRLKIGINRHPRIRFAYDSTALLFTCCKALATGGRQMMITVITPSASM